MSNQKETDRIARLKRELIKHPGQMVGFPPGEFIRCPGRRLDRRDARQRGVLDDRGEAARYIPCVYKWGRAGPDTTVYAQMVRGDLRTPTDPSLGPPPPLQWPNAFFKCPECECTIEILYLYNPLLEVADGEP